jgi:aryl carrier-like protein
MDDKEIKLFRFDGVQENWRGWKVLVLAYAEEKEFDDALLKDIAIPAVTTTNTADEKKLILSNKKAMRFLAMCCAKGKALPFVELANGSARNAWKALIKRYERGDDQDLIRLEKEFVTCNLEDYDDPESWIQQLVYLNA